MKIKLIFTWYDFGIGLFWDKKKKLLYFFPIPMIGLVLNFEKSKKKFICYEIHRPNIPADGCKTQCKECEAKEFMES